MVGPAGKTPRHKLTAAEKQLCLEALRRERRIRRAEEKEEMERQAAGGPQKKKAAKETGQAEAKIVMRTEGAEEAIRDATAADATESVAEAVSVMVATVASKTTTGEAHTTEADCARLAEQVTISKNRKRRRRILQVESSEDNEDLSSDEDGIEPTVPAIAACVVDGDPNLMDEGAEECTGLNSDEDTDVREEPEDEDDDGVDDGWDGDWDIGYLTDEEPDEEEDLPDSVWLSAAKDKKLVSAMRQNGWEYDPAKFGPDPTYAELYTGPFGPSDSVLRVADDPLALLFYFMPPKLWTQIALESNRYHTQTISQRARTIRSQQRGEVEDIGEIRRRLVNVADIEPWEILRVIALLIARMLVPIRKGIAAHWSLKKVGALPVNRFGQFMAKNRFFHIMGYLHFSNNKSPLAHTDRAWKIRPVVDVLQRTFSRGYKSPPVISFDEATLPSRSRFNPMRQFNKDKPHRWGTKVFVAACAKTAYCMRIEVYCGAKTHLRTPVPKYNNSGEAAVLRNLNALLPPSPTSPWRLVVTDRFYTSVKLALELLHRRLYLTGTIQTDRAGYAQGVVTSKKTKTVNNRKIMDPPQGTTKLAQNKTFPQLTAAMWMDRNPVHMLSSGGSRQSGIVMRRIRGKMQPLPAPELVRDYHRWMGGVDVHDQLRMQRYSVQLCYKTRKYYKTLFLGLLDMALVNAFIVHRYHKKISNKRPPKHFAFFEELMEQLLAVDSTEAFENIAASTCAEDRTAHSPGRGAQAPSVGGINVSADGHRLEENPDTVDCEQGVKRRHRTCKVCATYKVKPRKFTKYFCSECSVGNRRKYMCSIAREGRKKTCFQIWHEEWNNGNDIPHELLQGHKTRDRPPSSRPGKKRARQASQSRQQSEDAVGDNTQGGGESKSDASENDERMASET